MHVDVNEADVEQLAEPVQTDAADPRQGTG